MQEKTTQKNYPRGTGTRDPNVYIVAVSCHLQSVERNFTSFRQVPQTEVCSENCAISRHYKLVAVIS